MSDDPYREPDKDWEGVSFGAAAAEDEETVDELIEEHGGDVGEASEDFSEGLSAEGDIGQTPHRRMEG